MIFSKKKEKEEIANTDKNKVIKNGVKNIKSLIAPGGIDCSYTNHIEIYANRERFARTMVVSTLPRTTVFPEIFRKMYNFGDSNTSIFITPITAGKSQKELNDEINEIKSEIYVAESRGDENRARTLAIKSEELERLRDEIEAGYNSVFNASVMSTVFAYSKSDLDVETEKLTSAMSETLVTLKPAWALQDEAFISNMPFAENRIDEYNIFDRNSMGTVFPFINSEVGHTRGIPMGTNLQTGMPILYDNFDPGLTNYNMVVFGKSGAGKGVTIKVITARSYVLQGIESLALDVEGEYGPVAESLGGVNIVISGNSNTIINIFDIESETRQDEITKKETEVVDLRTKIEDVTQTLLIMAKGTTRTNQVNEVTKQIISEIVAAEYKAHGITEDPRSLYEGGILKGEGFERRRKKLPTIGSWYKRLIEEANANTEPDYRPHFTYLLKVMKQYVREEKGQFSYFDGQSTYVLKDGVPFINFDISRLEEKFARPLAQQILLSWIWEKYVKKNSEDRKKAKKKRVIIDEAWMLLPYDEAVDFLNAMARRARKRNVSLAILSQRFQDFYEKSEVQAVITSAETKLFLGQDSSEVDYLAEVFKLSAGEKSWISTAKVGEGLLKIGEDTALLKIDVTETELQFADTNVNTIAKREAEKQAQAGK